MTKLGGIQDKQLGALGISDDMHILTGLVLTSSMHMRTANTP
ncbi:MAG: hypothetical protein AB8B85_08005 [Paracoccaceae bacterium]